MSQTNVNFYRCDAPVCPEKWHEVQRVYVEADDQCLDFCSWECAIRYGLSLDAAVTEVEGRK